MNGAKCARGANWEVDASDVSIIIPTFNEEKNVALVINRLRTMGFKDILIVDGHSTDRTVDVALSLGARVVYQNGSGKGNALRRGFWECKDSSIVVMIDADGSMPPDEVPLYLKAVESGADVVKGSRFMAKGSSKDFTFMRKTGNRILTGLTNFLFLTNYTDLCYGFMAFSKDAISKLNPCLRGERFEIETEICVKAKGLGLKVIEVPSCELPRIHGTSNLRTFRDGFSILGLLLAESIRENKSQV
jgi:glycosyltransferase involved in cell wall biosynthesis